jgi:centromeric protein E
VNTQNKAVDEKVVRRSVSIAAFPQPPKSSRIGKLSPRPSLGATLITTNLDARPGSRDATTPTTPISSADSAKPKKLRKPVKTATLNSAFSSNAPSLLTGAEGVAVPANPPADFLNPPSPSQSRSSSAQGSYSTQATTFEEDEQPRRGREEFQDGSDRGSQSGKETKGNVIVSVRVRPDSGGDNQAEGEWMVDGRRSLVAFRGKEGGDYYYGNKRVEYVLD